MKALVTAVIVTPIAEGMTTGNTKFKKFAIAIKKGNVNTEGKTSVFGVKVFGKQADIGFRTGDKVHVDGSLTVEDFQVSPDKPVLQTAIINANFIEIADPSARLYAKAYNVLGNLTRDAQLKSFGSQGRQLSSTGLASSKKIGNNDHTSFIDIVLFDTKATALNPYLLKGQKVLVDGVLSASYYEKRENGGKSLDISILVDDFQFAGGVSKQNGAHVQQGQSGNVSQMPTDLPTIDTEEDEIPF